MKNPTAGLDYHERAEGPNRNLTESVKLFNQEKLQWDRGETPERHRKKENFKGLRLNELVRHFPTRKNSS